MGLQTQLNLPNPIPTSPGATKKMRANRRVDTKPEVALRSLLHKMGLRFRKDYPVRLLEGRTVHLDVAFTRKKIAVFVDGCFWHSCPEHGSTPKSNQEYWIPKLNQNIARDKSTTQGLQAEGWHVLRFWEHMHPADAAKQITDKLFV